MGKKESGKSGLNFFDANVFIGKHPNPFAASPFRVSHLAEFLGRNRLNEVLAYHSASVLYEASYGNRILIEETQTTNFLHRVWVALPEYGINTEAAEQFIATAGKYLIAAIKIFPRTHNFTVKNRSLDPLLSVLSEKRVPLFADQEEIGWDEVGYILDSFPRLKFILMNTGYRLGRFVYPLLRRYPNFHLEISRFQVHRGLEEMCRLFGSKQLLFGSGLPVFSPEPPMMMIHSAEISMQEKRNIAGENLRRLLGDV